MRRIVVSCVLLALVGVWFVNAGNLLIAVDQPVRVDAIIVLAGNAPDRLPYAERLMRQGYANLLVVSNEQVHTHGLETTWLALHKAGLSAPELRDDELLVLDDPPPESTLDEARRDSALLQAHGLHSVLLVTDAFHSRRATLLFRAAFAHAGLSVRSTPVQPDPLDLAHWWSHGPTARVVLEEWSKLALYAVEGAYF
ncbi:MAG: YdcF family protein [Chloroflexi bacterium]|nr:YdcF family protein [Chloroflexota bacterium]